MSIKRLPFNISLLKLTPGQIRLLKPIKSLDTVDAPGSSDFHPEGLFSTEIFGRVGEDSRDETFAYIPLKTTILHPVVFQRLERLKRLYSGILSGKSYAVWDDKEKDFVQSTEVDGKTGYHFFMSKWKDIKFKKGDSEIRNQRIDLINKYREEAVIKDVLVMPAGLRDAEIDAIGRTQEDEINSHYRRLIGIVNTIGDGNKNDGPILDNARYSLQMTFNEIYFTIEKMLSGKKGFIQNKYGSRRIMNGTRNVISAMELSPPDLDESNFPEADDTVVGLFQCSRGALPITINRLSNNILQSAFGDVEGQVRLIDRKTLRSEFVNVSTQTFDRWTTTDGLEAVISSQEMTEARSKPVVIEDRYLALVYKPKNNKVFKVFYDIDELPDGFDKDDVYPLTLHEMIYLCNYSGWNNLRIQSTRYPVTGEESSYLSRVFVRTTVKSEERVELDANWEEQEPTKENTAYVYPIFDPDSYIDSQMVHSYRLGGLGGDFDGDTVSGNIIYTKEAIAEVDKHLNSREAHVDPSGGLRASASIDTIQLVMHNMTGDA